jgi:hypothetical protein
MAGLLTWHRRNIERVASRASARLAILPDQERPSRTVAKQFLTADAHPPQTDHQRHRP